MQRRLRQVFGGETIKRCWRLWLSLDSDEPLASDEQTARFIGNTRGNPYE
jgi:hypothetical protein